MANKCGPLGTCEDRVDKDGKHPIILQSWRLPKSCNHKSGQQITTAGNFTVCGTVILTPGSYQLW